MAEFRSDRRRLIGGGVILAGAGLAATFSSGAKGESTTAESGWAPAPETIDSWLDKPGTRHRMAFDSIGGEGGAEALGYANNFLHVNEADYGLKPEQVGVVVIFRHMSTPYGYNNSIWAKYGKKFAEQMKLDPDSAMRAATMNPVLTADPADKLPKGAEWAADGTLSALAPKGVRFAVCGLATTGIAAQLAGKGGDAKAIEAELKSNLVPGALIVPAGISTVNRAQEHGYTFAYIG
jgi:intracellular sulfur oxidation DsrE/DsrF family protein